MIKQLDIFGAGQVGCALGRTWAESGAFAINRIRNRTLESARKAVRFIGQGRAVSMWGNEPAQVIMVSASDSAIAAAVDVLMDSDIITAETVVFHCSGAQSFELLTPLKARGASIASLHPVKSFADADRAARTLAGTCFCVEGDEQAAHILADAVHSIAGQVFRISPLAKSVYHAGSIFACGYLMAALSAGIDCLRVSGLSPEDAAAILKPVASETVNNFFDRGAVAVLTGPVLRGEVSLVDKQLSDIERIIPELADAYRALGTLVLRMAVSQGKLSQQTIERFSALFAGSI